MSAIHKWLLDSGHSVSPPSQTFQSGGSCGEKLSSNKAGMIYEADMSTGASSHVKASGGVLENGVKTGSES